MSWEVQNRNKSLCNDFFYDSAKNTTWLKLRDDATHEHACHCVPFYTIFHVSKSIRKRTLNVFISVTNRVIMSKFGKNWGNTLNHALVTRPRQLCGWFRNQSDDSNFFPPSFYQSRAGKTCFGTSCDIQSILPFLLLFPVRCTCYVGDVLWTKRNCQCCRKYSLLDPEKLAKSTAIPRRKFDAPNTSFCRFNDR